MSWTHLREAESDDTLGRRQLGRKVVLMYLARRADDRGVTKLGSRIIAQDTGTDHRRVRRLLDELCEMGRIDLVERGRNGRGHAHTWRVLSMAEWLERESRKGGVGSAFPEDRKEGVDDTEKGAKSPPPEQSPTSPPLPPAERGESDHRSETQVRTSPSLPGLGRGEEGMPAIGRGRRRPRADRKAEEARQRREEDRRRRQEIDDRQEADRRRHEREEAKREATREERIALARAALERVRSTPAPRSAAGGRR